MARKKRGSDQPIGVGLTAKQMKSWGWINRKTDEKKETN